MTAYNLASMKAMNEAATLHALLKSFGVSASEGQAFTLEGSATLRKLGRAVPRLGPGWCLYTRGEGVVSKDDGTCVAVSDCIIGRSELWPYPASVEGGAYQPFDLIENHQMEQYLVEMTASVRSVADPNVTTKNQANRENIVPDQQASMPIYAEYKGDTVAELVNFLSRYPGDMKARLLCDDTLVARMKGDTLFLRLDS